jgi:hypothetical protein
MRSVILVGMLSAVAAKAETVPFGPGEQARYEVRFLGIPAGVAHITVGMRIEQHGASVLPLVCVGQTTSVASIFRIRDRFVSYFDPATQHPVGAEFHVDENGRRRREVFRFNQEPLKVHAFKKKEGQEGYPGAYDVPEGTMDLASAAFWLRARPIVVGDVHEVPIFTGSKWYVMRAAVEAQEKLETKLGEVEVFRVSVSTDFQGSAETKGNILVYYTADERRLPVRVIAEFVVGSATADIVEYHPGSASL